MELAGHFSSGAACTARYLVINHGWQKFRSRSLGHDLSKSSTVGRLFAILVTFTCVVVAWVFFRSTSLGGATEVLRAMFGSNGFVFPEDWRGPIANWTPIPIDTWRFGNLEAFGGLRQVIWSATLLVVVFAFPNSQQIVSRFEAMIRSEGIKAERWAWGVTGFISVFVFVVAAINDSRGVSEFIYFNF